MNIQTLHLQVFSGGMPRASYGDKFTVTVMRQEEGEEEQHTVFDLTSKIVDFLVVEGGEGGPDYLLILSEEELVCVDLCSPSWPALEAPYMQSIHSSAITTIIQVTRQGGGPSLAGSSGMFKRCVGGVNWDL